MRDLRLGVYDVIVGINLLREGLDLPEVSLVAILDADKEGYLRSKGALIQTMGRAARHIEGHVIMYADTITVSMHEAIEETKRRRQIQEDYNQQHGITPQGIRKAIKDITERVAASVAEEKAAYDDREAAERPGHQGRSYPPDQGPGSPDETGGQEPGIRKSRSLTRPYYRAYAESLNLPTWPEEPEAMEGDEEVIWQPISLFMTPKSISVI